MGGEPMKHHVLPHWSHQARENRVAVSVVPVKSLLTGLFPGALTHDRRGSIGSMRPEQAPDHWLIRLRIYRSCCANVGFVGKTLAPNPLDPCGSKAFRGCSERSASGLGPYSRDAGSLSL